MFEHLLQADQALAQGLLDEAEKLYEQALDMDPTSAMAMAGLARVALERDDPETAGILADRALAIDPDNAVAAQVAAAIAGDAPEAPRDGAADETLAAAHRLESLARPTRPSEAETEAALAAATSGGDKPADGAILPEPLPEMPAEPLKGRRQLGRQVAAAAAAMHDVARPIETRRRAGHGGGRAPAPDHRAPDPFAAAEAEAMVEEGDAFDELEAAAAEAEAGAGAGADEVGADSSLTAAAGLTAEPQAPSEIASTVVELGTGQGLAGEASGAEMIEAAPAGEPGRPPALQGVTEEERRAFLRELTGSLGDELGWPAAEPEAAHAEPGAAEPEAAQAPATVDETVLELEEFAHRVVDPWAAPGLRWTSRPDAVEPEPVAAAPVEPETPEGSPWTEEPQAFTPQVGDPWGSEIRWSQPGEPEVIITVPKDAKEPAPADGAPQPESPPAEGEKAQGQPGKDEHPRRKGFLGRFGGR